MSFAVVVIVHVVNFSSTLSLCLNAFALYAYATLVDEMEI